MEPIESETASKSIKSNLRGRVGCLLLFKFIKRITVTQLTSSVSVQPLERREDNLLPIEGHSTLMEADVMLRWLKDEGSQAIGGAKGLIHNHSFWLTCRNRISSNIKNCEKNMTTINGDCRILESCVVKICSVSPCCCFQCQIYRIVYPIRSAKYPLFPFGCIIGRHLRGEQTLRCRYQNKCVD